MTDCDGVPSEYDAVPSYLGAEPETYADWKLRHEDEIAAFFEALSFLSEGESLLEQKSTKKVLHHHTVTRSRQSKDRQIDSSFLDSLCCGVCPFLVVGVFVWLIPLTNEASAC